MELVRKVLTWIFTYLLYPAVVIGVFAYIVGMLVVIVNAGRRPLAKLRRATGAILPLVVLVFFFATRPGTIHQIDVFVNDLGLLPRFLIGAVVGVVLMETGKLLLKTDGDGAAALYALFLSSLGTFLT